VPPFLPQRCSRRKPCLRTGRDRSGNGLPDPCSSASRHGPFAGGPHRRDQPPHSQQSNGSGGMPNHAPESPAVAAVEVVAHRVQHHTAAHPGGGLGFEQPAALGTRGRLAAAELRFDQATASAIVDPPLEAAGAAHSREACHTAWGERVQQGFTEGTVEAVEKGKSGARTTRTAPAEPVLPGVSGGAVGGHVHPSISHQRTRSRSAGRPSWCQVGGGHAILAIGVTRLAPLRPSCAASQSLRASPAATPTV
jgi:hypothetical protein